MSQKTSATKSSTTTKSSKKTALKRTVCIVKDKKSEKGVCVWYRGKFEPPVLAVPSIGWVDVVARTEEMLTIRTQGGQLQSWRRTV